MKYIKTFIIWGIIHSAFQFLYAQGLILNEFSQGTMGAREYAEYLVIGTAGTTVDLRGWIIDDNNGIFSAGASANLGINSGYIEFDSICEWEQVPVGALIVLYNGLDINPLVAALGDDPTDADLDSVYVIGINGGTPVSCVTPAINDYLTANRTSPNTADLSYGVPNQDPCWNLISFRDGGDAHQIRRPDGTFFHGISTANVAGLGGCTGGTGLFPCELRVENHPTFGTLGINSLHFATFGGNTAYYFDNTVDNDFSNINNWIATVATTLETPGAGNSAANTAYINSLRAHIDPSIVTDAATCNLRPNDARYFLNAADEIILKLENNTATNHGTTIASIDVAGAEAQNLMLTGSPLFASTEWQIVPATTTGTDNYTVTFYVPDAVLNSYALYVNGIVGTGYTGASVIPQLQIYKRDGLQSPINATADFQVEIITPNVGSFIGDVNTFTTFEGTFTTFSTFRLGSPISILPISLASFDLELTKENEVRLDWRFATDFPKGELEIERSMDGFQFEKIGGVENISANTSFIDTRPNKGKNYYRISWTDINGQQSYSDTRSLWIENELPLQMTPMGANPLGKQFLVNAILPQAGHVELEVWSMQGQRVKSEKQLANSTHVDLAFDISDLTSGLYLFKLKSSGQEAILRLVKR